MLESSLDLGLLQHQTNDPYGGIRLGLSVLALATCFTGNSDLERLGMILEGVSGLLSLIQRLQIPHLNVVSHRPRNAIDIHTAVEQNRSYKSGVTVIVRASRIVRAKVVRPVVIVTNVTAHDSLKLCIRLYDRTSHIAVYVLQIINRHNFCDGTSCSCKLTALAVKVDSSLLEIVELVVQGCTERRRDVHNSVPTAATEAAAGGQHADCQDAGQRQGKNAFESWTLRDKDGPYPV